MPHGFDWASLMMTWGHLGHYLGTTWGWLGDDLGTTLAKLGKTLVYSGTLWHTLAYSVILWHTLAYSDILWHTLAYSGILWLDGAWWCKMVQDWLWISDGCKRYCCIMFPLASLVVSDWCFLVGLWPCTPCRVSISVMLGMVIKGRWLFINDRHILSQ